MHDLRDVALEPLGSSDHAGVMTRVERTSGPSPHREIVRRWLRCWHGVGKCADSSRAVAIGRLRVVRSGGMHTTEILMIALSTVLDTETDQLEAVDDRLAFAMQRRVAGVQAGAGRWRLAHA